MPGPERPGRARRWLNFPLLLLPVKAVLVVAPMVVGLGLARGTLHWSRSLTAFVAGPASIALSVALFVLYTRAVERRAVTELAPRAAGRATFIGFALGTLCMAIVIAILALLGRYRIDSVGDASVLLVPLVGMMVAAVFEELLFRGVLFRIAEDALGSYWALAISAIFFGAAHLLNPHASWLGASAIMIEAGLSLAAAYMVSGRLWLPIGIHAGWNFTEGGVFGTAVSGTAPHGLLHGTLTGPAWLSGGEFGPEASVIAIVVCGALGLAFLLRARRLNRIVPPFWRRRAIAAATAAATSA